MIKTTNCLFMKKMLIVFVVMLLLLQCCATVAVSDGQPGWLLEDGYLRYYKNGTAVTGTDTIDGKVYYFESNGALKGNGKVQYTSYGYVYPDASNVLQTGWKTVGGEKYYFDPNTRSAWTGYRGKPSELGGEKYLFGTDGVLFISEWAEYWGDKYYADANGHPVTGYRTIDSKNYYFDTTGLAQRGFQNISGELHYFLYDCSEALGWQIIDKQIYYFDPSTGVMQASQRTIDGKTYQFYEDGKLNHSTPVVLKFADGAWYGFDLNHDYLSGWQTIDGATYYFSYSAYIGQHGIYDSKESKTIYYYFDENGKMQSNYWMTNSDGRKYYFGSDGKRVSGWQTIDGATYYFSNGSAYIGSCEIYENSSYYYYYFDKDGKMQSNYWLIVDGKRFYYGSDGKQLYGWQKIGGKTYYFGEYMWSTYVGYYAFTGSHDLQDESGNTYSYYFDSEGVMQTSYWLVNADGYKYYYGSDGKRVYGWQTIDGATYYFGSSAYTGLCDIYDGSAYSYYYFDKDGKMQSSCWLSNEDGSKWYYGSDGKRVYGWQTIDGATYYFDPSVFTGSHEIYDGSEYNFYYFDKDGKMQSGCWLTFSGKKYYYGADGKQPKGWKKIGSDTYYFYNDYSGYGYTPYTGLQEFYDGNKWDYYYFDAEGKMKTNYWLTVDERKYYFGSDGKRLSGLQTIDGVTYYLDDSVFIGVKTLTDDKGNIIARYAFDNNGRMVTGWYTDKWDSKYYFNTDGKGPNGFTVVDGDTYYFEYGYLSYSSYTDVVLEKDGKQIKAVFDKDGKLLAARKYLGASGWQLMDDGSWAYGDSDGYAFYGSHRIDELYYCFDATGRMITGWGTAYRKWYYGNASGVLYHDGWQEIGGTWYYFRSDGEMATGWVNDYSGTIYYMDENGQMKTGWVFHEGDWYYMDETGARKTGWMQVGNDWYYFRPGGQMAVGWVSDGVSWYYFSPSGVMRSGWFEDTQAEAADGSSTPYWYWFDYSGTMATGWTQITGTWYYFTTSGLMKTGWLEDTSGWYWFDNSGTMATGWKEIDGRWEFFNETTGIWEYTWTGE